MTFLHQNTHRKLTIVLGAVCLIFVLTLYKNWPWIIRHIVEWQRVFHELLASLINAISQDPVHHGLRLIALSFVYGVFHAVGPGHGKAVIIVYLGSHKESLHRGAVISLLAALLQSLVAIFLVVILSQLLSLKFSQVNQYADQIKLVSYLLVMGLGIYLFVSAASKQWSFFRKKASDHHDHDHHHAHDHSCCGHKHAHQSDPKETWLQSLSVVFSMGIRPCAGAIIVLIYAHLVGVFVYGVVATFMMGLGTGLSIAGMAIGTQLARNWFEKMALADNQTLLKMNLGAWIKMCGGVIIFLLGFSLYQAATQVIGPHPLF